MSCRSKGADFKAGEFGDCGIFKDNRLISSPGPFLVVFLNNPPDVPSHMLCLPPLLFVWEAESGETDLWDHTAD